MHDQSSSAPATFLFTDIEGSTRLWEQEPERMRPALARHDALARSAVEQRRGVVVKMTGDGVHGAFEDPVDAIGAALELQQALADPGSTLGIPLRIRCGLHVGVVERRDNDFFGTAVNRAARIMASAHGGQVLLSQPVADLVRDRLPAGATLRDLGTVRLRDLASPERIFQLAHPALRAEFPALRSLEATPNNLPQQLSSFVGRERELADVKALLRQSRLVTLFGTGGLGKTRLSLHVAADVMDDLPDGVWFVDLAPLSDSRLVPQVVATVLGVKEQAGYPVIEALVKYAADRRLLLILDNCEHLASACAELCKRLLQAGPQVRILASSREHLGITGETTYPVSALAIPETTRSAAAEELVGFESVRLFVERATAVQPAFRLSDGNATAVADICRRLDGIALALELAAARVRTMSVENIAARLDDRFRLLSTGDRTALPRQQTLRALIDWSYDLLTEAERALFGRLSVFVGGWTLDAAEAVGMTTGSSGSDVIDVLPRLVEKSLVLLEADGDRYRMLQTVRHYAQDRLAAAADASDAHTRHFEYYVALAESAKPELVGPQQGTWLARLDVERENLLAAHRWADRASDQGARGLSLVNALKQYWINRGLLELGHAVTVEALERPGARLRNAERSRGLVGAGQLCCVMGRYGEALGHLDQSLAIAREIGDPGRVAAVLQPLALASLGHGDTELARMHLEEALALARELGNQREIAAALNALAQVRRVEGALDAAEPLYRQVIDLGRELGDNELISIGLLNSAMVSIGRGRGDRAAGMLLEVLANVESSGSKRTGQSVLEVCAGLAALREEWSRAARFFGSVEAQAAVTGLKRDPTDEAFLTPLIGSARRALGESGFGVADAEGRSLDYEKVIIEARAWLEGSREPGIASR